MVYEYIQTLLKNVHLFILYSNNSIAEGLRRSYNGSGFLSDFVDRYINLFILLCAIEWGVDHNSIIPECGVISQYVIAVILR